MPNHAYIRCFLGGAQEPPNEWILRLLKGEFVGPSRQNSKKTPLFEGRQASMRSVGNVCIISASKLCRCPHVFKTPKHFTILHGESHVLGRFLHQVKQNGLSLTYASAALKNDKDRCPLHCAKCRSEPNPPKCCNGASAD